MGGCRPFHAARRPCRRRPRLETAARQRYAGDTITAKEKLRRAVEELSEAEAANALEILVGRRDARERTSLDELLDNAPIDDESETEEERRAVAEGREDLRRGDTVSLDEIRSELS